MTILYGELPSASNIKRLCLHSEDKWLFLQASTTLFAALTTIFAILFILPLVIAAPVGMICGTTFWSGDLLAVEAWVRSALLSALTTAGVLVGASVCIRLFTRFQFGSPSFHGEMQVDLSYDETRKLVRNYLRANSIDQTYGANKSQRRHIGLMEETRFSNTYLEVRLIELDYSKTLVSFRGVSKLNGLSILMATFYTDFGRSQRVVCTLMKGFKPYASSKKHRSAVQSKQALPKVKLHDVTPPPAVPGRRGYAGRNVEADLRRLKACS